MSRTEITVFDRTFKNPVIAASGTYGYGDCYEKYYNPGDLGGVALKGLTLEPRAGNSGVRLWETPSGLLNSIGLENPGLEDFRRDYLPSVKSLSEKTHVFANIAGHSESDYLKVIEGLSDAPYLLIELNLSCPNVKNGLAFGMDPKAAAGLIKKIKSEFSRPIVVKLTPNAPSIVDVAMAVEDAGADGVSLINTINGLAIDVDRREFVFKNVTAGLSGPAVKPIALRMVHDVASKVNIPVIGIGGISSGRDALEFIMAGASLVEVGTAGFHEPWALLNIARDLEEWCRERDERLESLVGIL